LVSNGAATSAHYLCNFDKANLFDIPPSKFSENLTVGSAVTLTTLLEQLIQLEWSIGTEAPIEIRHRVIEAEESLLELHAQVAEMGKLVDTPEDRKRFNALQQRVMDYSFHLH
jgi:hypothetical protein